MPSQYVKEWGNVFNAAAVVFTKDVSGLTKTDKDGGSGLRRTLEPVQSPLAVIKALDALDKISLDQSSKDQIKALPANMKLYKAALADLGTAKTKFIADIDEALNMNITVSPNGIRTPTPMKTVAPDSYRQVKLLRAEVDAIYARAANALNAAAVQGAKNKQFEELEKARRKLADKGQENITAKDEAKMAAMDENAAMKNFLLEFSAAFKSGMAKGAAVIQRIKASPTLAIYNKEMNNGGRDISQQLVNITKLKANPKFASSSLAKKLPDPGDLGPAITPFANGARRHLPDNATPAEIKKALEDFTAVYKRIADKYADVLAGKL